MEHKVQRHFHDAYDDAEDVARAVARVAVDGDYCDCCCDLDDDVELLVHRAY